MDRETVITDIRRLSADLLDPLVRAALEHAAAQVARSEAGAELATSLLDSVELTSDRFSKYLGFDFDELEGLRTRKIDLGDYPSLSLVDEEFIEAANALEGMVNYARNTNIKALISFNTRLNELFENETIDETNSPLDPDRIAVAFVDALAPFEIDRRHLLPVYRSFNQHVLRQLDHVLQQADRVCIAAGLLPDLVVDGRSREAHLKKSSSVRPTNSPLERAFAEARAGAQNSIANASSQLYSLVKQLLWCPATESGSCSESPGLVREIAVPTAALIARHFDGSLVSELGLIPLIEDSEMLIAGRAVVLISNAQLMLLLDHVQDRLIEELSDSEELEVDYRKFTNYLGEELLETSPAGQLNAINGESLDIVLTINLLYEAFCNDVSLVYPIKELIAATQVVVMKMALDDSELFLRPGHPVRLLLNEVASAGVGSLDHETLRNDAVFIKLESILIRLVTEYEGNAELVTGLLDEFHAFKSETLKSTSTAEAVAKVADAEGRERVSEINKYVRSRIEERIQEPLHPLIDNLVRQYFHRFLVGVVQRDGQGSSSWTLVTKILDLLLWTVKADKQESDRQRFEELNEMLLDNIKKVLLVSGLDEDAGNSLITSIVEIQENSFCVGLGRTRSGNVVRINARTFALKNADCNEEILTTLVSERPTAEPLYSVGSGITGSGTGAKSLATHRELSQHLPQVDKLPIGSWLSFRMGDNEDLCCTLTARLQSVDKLVFVNSKGVKVLEKTREGLARELQQGSVRIVSEWPLFERGMESVVARLRERQQRQYRRP
jgi:hypothetical protein